MTEITARLDEGMSVTLSNGRHEWLADEPVLAGGADTGPNPYELLLGSLASCTCITIAWYCSKKKIPLGGVSARYEFGRIYADDCADCDIPDRGFLEKVTSHVHIEGDFDDALKKRLTQVASRCPVHKTLAQGMEIEDRVSF